MKLTSIYPRPKTESNVEVKRDRTRSSNRETGNQPGSADDDRVVLSTGSRDVQTIRTLLDETPNIRSEKVDVIRDLIERGEYDIDPIDIANKMIESFLSDTPYDA